MARLGTATHLTIRVENMFWYNMTFSTARVPLGSLCENSVRLSGSAACCAESFAFPPHISPQKQIGTSLFDAFVSRIANQDGLRSMQKNALTKGHPRKCQSVRSTLTAYGVRMNPCTAPAEST